MNTCAFLGKGGVGKTTLALAWGLRQAQEGRKTLVLSLDPAHNLKDYTGVAAEDRPTPVAANLWIQEVDIDRRAREALEQVLSLVKTSYRHLEVLNLERALDTLRYAPGAEESAYLAVLEEVKAGPWQAVALDLPPTGLALRLVHHPYAGLLWVQRLLALRKQIRELETTISRLQGETPGQDPVLQELLRLLERYRGLLVWFREIHWLVVFTPEEAAQAEARRIRQALERLGLERLLVFCNRCSGGEALAPFRAAALRTPLRFPEDFAALSRFLPPGPPESPGTA